MKKVLLPPPNSPKLNFAFIALVFILASPCSDCLGAVFTYDFKNRNADDLFLSGMKMPGDSVFPCQQSFDITLQDGYHVSTNDPSGAVWSGKEIHIENNAIVHFDRNVTMEKCTLRIGSNAKIIIEGAYGLTTSDECLFTICSAMWNGIEVSANSFVNLDDTEFWYARSALFFKKDFNTYNTLIKNCAFKNNDIGIEVGNSQNTVDVNTIFTPQQLHNNVFEGGNLISPLNGHKSYAGISLHRCAFAFIGTSGPNTFKNLSIGIACRRTSAIITQADFSDMYVQFGTGGYGITSGESHLYVYGCNFSDDATGGIYSEAAKSLSIYESDFIGEERYGIFSENSTKLAYASIVNNEFTLNKAAEISAIYHERSPSGGLTSISDKVYNLIEHNAITVTNDHAKTHDISLIDVYSPFNGLNKFPIQNNIITVNSPSTPIHGIYVRGASNKLKILGNTLDYPITPAPSQVTATLAIAVEEVFGGSNELSDNTITSTFWANETPEEKTSYVKCGIHLYKSPGFQVCGNTLDETYRAFHFAGNLSYCDFAVNNIGRHYHGIHCIKWLDGMQTNLGNPQDWHENVWSTSVSDYSGFAAKYEDNSSAPFVFDVDGTIAGHMPPSISISNWFFNIPTGESNSKCVSPLDPPTPEITDSDIKVINETYPVESEAGQWDLERELLLKLLTYPELMPATSVEETWYNGKVNSSPWKFAQAEKAFLDAYEFPDQLQYDLDSLYSRYSVLWDDLLELDSLQRIDPYTIDNDILQDQISVSESFEEVRGAIDGLLSECNDFTISGLIDTKDWNDDLPDTVVYEANLKYVYKIALKSARGYTLTENECDTLRDIAGQCPLEGGSAVRIAPYHLPHAEAVTYLREEQGTEACEAIERGQTGVLLRDLEITLSPNPANDLITIQLSKAVIDFYSVYDLTGKVLLEKASSAASNKLDIPLNNIPNGIFFLRITDESNRVYTRKFVIAH